MIRWLSIIVVIYMLAALTWWTVLLHRGQAKLTEAKERILQLVFAIALILGIFYLYRLYKKELSVASQQKKALILKRQILIDFYML